jgi:hypothetical protein
MAKADSVLDRMREYSGQKGAPVTVQRINKGYSIIHESGEPVARFRPRAGESSRVEVLWSSHRDKWDHIGDFGGLFMGLEEALGYVLSEPMGVFWKRQNRGITSASTRTGGKLGLLASLAKLFGAGR